MSGNRMGSLKRKLGLKGKTQPGEMIKRMNDIKCKTLGQYVGGAFNGVGRELQSVGSGLGTGVTGLGKGIKLAGQMGQAFVRNATGGDIKKILKKTKKYAK